MRKIEIAMCEAIKAERDWELGNTSVYAGTRPDGVLGWGFKFAGWPTSTTRSRINAIRDMLGLSRVYFVNGVPHVDGKELNALDWFA